jgi:hypothetical protein
MSNIKISEMVAAEAGQSDVLPAVTPALENTKVTAQSVARMGANGMSHTGAFAGKPLDNSYVWEPGVGINYTQADVDDGVYKVLSLDPLVHAAVDNPYWSNPVPTGNTGIGLFQGAYLPHDVTKLFDYDYDYNAQYPPLIPGTTEGYKVVSTAASTIPTPNPQLTSQFHTDLTQVSTTGTGTGIILQVTFNEVNPGSATGDQYFVPLSVRVVRDPGSGYNIGDEIVMEGLGGLVTATVEYIDPFIATGFEGSTGRIYLNDLKYGDKLNVRFDFNIIPQIANTTVEAALWYANRGEDDAITYTFPLTAQPTFYGEGTVGNSYLNRTPISAWIASSEDTNALTLPAIKADNPIIIQPLGLLVSIDRGTNYYNI